MTCDKDCLHCSFADCIRPETADVNEQKAEWRRNNPEKVKTIRKRYYRNHIEQERERRKKWYQENKDKVISAHKEKRDKRKQCCDKCESLKEISDAKGKKCNMCMASMRVINRSYKSSPDWCPKRKKAERVS